MEYFSDKELEVLANMVDRTLRKDERQMYKPDISKDRYEHLQLKISLLRSLLDKLERIRMVA